MTNKEISKPMKRSSVLSSNFFRKDQHGWFLYILAFSAICLNAEHIACVDHDLFVNRCSLQSELADVVGDTSSATFEPGEPSHSGADGGKTIWWQFQAPQTGWVTIDIQDGDFLPLMVVYQGSSVSELIEVTRNENDVDGSLMRQLGFLVQEDENFEIVATGKGEDAGLFQFQLTVRPPNDLFKHRERVQLGQTHRGHNRFASMEQNEPIHNTTGPLHATGYASVWYEFIAPEGVRQVTFEILQQAFVEGALPSVAVYEGESFPEDAEFLAANYSGVRNLFSFVVQPGNTYQIAIDGYKSWPHEIPTAFGSFEFQLREAELIENDDYRQPNPVLLEAEPVLVSALEASENLGGDPDFGGAPAGSSLWWYWDSVGIPQCITIHAAGVGRDASDFSPWIGVYSGEVNADSVGLGSAQGTFTFCTDSVPTRYVFGLNHDSWEDVSAYSISLRSTVAPVNDDFSNALTIEVGDKVVGDNYSATSAASDPVHSGNLQGSGSVWWKWTADQSGSILIQTKGSTFSDGLLLSVWEGDEPSAFQQVARNFRVPEPPSDSSYPNMSTYATFEAEVGEVYWVMVEGHENALGEIELLVETVEAPGNDHIDDAAEIVVSERLTGSNRGATMESGELEHAGYYPGQTLWWKWTAPTFGFVEIAHASGDDSIKCLVTVYADSSTEGVAFDSLIPLGSNRTRDGTFEDQFTLVINKGRTYYIAVNSRNGDLGTVDLNFTFQPEFYFGNTRFVDGGIEIDVVGEMGIGPQYILEASTNLQTWEPMEQTHQLIDGQGVIKLQAISEFAHRFFRIIESDGD